MSDKKIDLSKMDKEVIMIIVAAGVLFVAIVMFVVLLFADNKGIEKVLEEEAARRSYEYLQEEEERVEDVEILLPKRTLSETRSVLVLDEINNVLYEYINFINAKEIAQAYEMVASTMTFEEYSEYVSRTYPVNCSFFVLNFNKVSDNEYDVYFEVSVYDKGDVGYGGDRNFTNLLDYQINTIESTIKIEDWEDILD